MGGDGVAGGPGDGGGERLFAGRAFEAAGAGRGGRRKFEAIEIDFGADVVEVLAVKEAVEEVLDDFHWSDRLLRSL